MLTLIWSKMNNWKLMEDKDRCLASIDIGASVDLSSNVCNKIPEEMFGLNVLWKLKTEIFEAWGEKLWLFSQRESPQCSHSHLHLLTCVLWCLFYIRITRNSAVCNLAKELVMLFCDDCWWLMLFSIIQMPWYPSIVCAACISNINELPAAVICFCVFLYWLISFGVFSLLEDSSASHTFCTSPNPVQSWCHYFW